MTSTKVCELATGQRVDIRALVTLAIKQQAVKQAFETYTPSHCQAPARRTAGQEQSGRATPPALCITKSCHSERWRIARSGKPCTSDVLRCTDSARGTAHQCRGSKRPGSRCSATAAGLAASSHGTHPRHGAARRCSRVARISAMQDVCASTTLATPASQRKAICRDCFGRQQRMVDTAKPHAHHQDHRQLQEGERQAGKIFHAAGTASRPAPSTRVKSAAFASTCRTGSARPATLNSIPASRAARYGAMAGSKAKGLTST